MRQVETQRIRTLCRQLSWGETARPIGSLLMPTPRPLHTLANVGKATLGDFERLGIRTRAQLARRNAYRLYERLCALTAQRHDPCVIDVFLATISECRGNAPRDWWLFTPERKRALAANPRLAPTAAKPSTRVLTEARAQARTEARTEAATQSAGASRSRRDREVRAARRSRSQDAASRSAR